MHVVCGNGTPWLHPSAVRRQHLPEANLPVTRSLSTRMARWGLVIVGIYLLVALITPLLVSAGVLPDANAGLENPIYPLPAGPIGAAPTGVGMCGHHGRQWSGASGGVAGGGCGPAGRCAPGHGEGYFGGAVDRLMGLLMDTLYTLPVLLLSVVLAFLLGKGIPNAAAALCVVYVPQYFRVVRNWPLR